ncbi:MAG TPA: carbonate dehydratase [Bacteroidetes bacterium]|nr:carbonate dehydratase [Bacteroidota bacterium]
MDFLPELFVNNRTWATRLSEQDPALFEKMATQQNPEILWIGCSDSRVPANQIVGLLPGELFVHRNVANMVHHTDMNCLSVMQYAIEMLHIRHIIVCGHYGCGGVKSVVDSTRHGLIDNWLQPIKEVYKRYEALFPSDLSHKDRINRLCELNVVEQAYNVSQSTVVQNAWERGHSLTLHAWIYGLHDGLLRDLGMCIASQEQVEPLYIQALELLEAANVVVPTESQINESLIKQESLSTTYNI